MRFMGQFTYHISLKIYKETVKQWRRKPSHHHFAHVNNKILRQIINKHKSFVIKSIFRYLI